MLLKPIEALELPKSVLLYTLAYAGSKSVLKKGCHSKICLKVRTICTGSMSHDLTDVNALPSFLPRGVSSVRKHQSSRRLCVFTCT